MENNHPYAEQIDLCLQMFQQARKWIDETLSAPELATVKLTLDAQLLRATSTLSSLTGVYMNNDSTVKLDLKPVTSFMGQPIVQTAPVTVEELQPEKTEADKFLEERDALYDRFLTMTDEEVFKLMNQPLGTALIRSVAKKAETVEFRDAELNVEYLKLIRSNIISQQELQQAVETADHAAAMLAADTTNSSESTGDPAPESDNPQEEKKELQPDKTEEKKQTTGKKHK